ncbi:TPR repeat protein [Gregarina niphandrodes]|uniref:TPR repeat protein n=1 Tax=Gregarina niphandrodes TaxID=110365 RepID=A0A023B3F7_GRENI|nr:TPR repeat protein [Gregarina niphandrodes]EZG55286.1 TPR repeat protein [Gregarina niphandrodes]|eukprot:XP_011131665.1 TPR repeat protein [Gregarina niphandrodes]
MAVKTSAAAWEFVRSVTGYGYEGDDQSAGADHHVCGEHARVEAAGVEDAAGSSSAPDALDYRRFEKIVDSSDEEKAPDEATVVRQKAEEVTRTLFSSGQGEVEGEVEDDTSKYFKASSAIQGCAHDRSKERALFERPNDEKLMMANRFRFAGNDKFKAKDFEQAACCYLRGIIQLEYTFPDTPSEEARYNEIKLACHLNMAAAKFNQDDYTECFVQCGNALRVDPVCAKARFRQGQCHVAWCEYTKAQKAFLEAKEMNPDLTAACDQALGLVAAEAKRDTKGSIFEGMFT